MQRKVILLILPLMIAIASKMTAKAETIEVPKEVVEISEELGVQYNICPELIQAICFKESSFNSCAENDGCIGIMQVNPDWHKDRMDRLGVTDLYDTRSNMLVGVDYLSELVQEYEDISIALMKYNGDSHADGAMNGTADISGYTNSTYMRLL